MTLRAASLLYFMHHQEFETLKELRAHLKEGGTFACGVFQGLDLQKFTKEITASDLRQTVFLGCHLEHDAQEAARKGGAVIFPNLPNLPYQAYRGELYSADVLMGDYVPGDPDSYAKTLDGRVYSHYMMNGKDSPYSILETLAQRLHDHSITDAVEEFIENKRVVAIMGGHSMSRADAKFLEVALIARELALKGFLLGTGGGPGAMEATHAGVWFMHREEKELTDAVAMLAEAPYYNDAGWLDQAFAVRKKYPLKGKGKRMPESLGIPTWLYGHEPPTVFATHIAKYFANSVREEGVLALATYGVIFSPGSAGTIQEIFQDVTQNHYKSFEVVSPMILFSEDYWKVTKPVYPLLAQLAAGNEYARYLSITDSRKEVVKRILSYAEEREKY